jgi:hypothetical protein
MEDAMLSCTFKALSMYEPEAKPRANLIELKELGAFHEAPGMIELLPKIERFAVWFAAQLKFHGIAARGLFGDSDGWGIEVPSNTGFVLCMFSPTESDHSLIHMLVSEMGDAMPATESAARTILGSAPEITELKLSK